MALYVISSLMHLHKGEVKLIKGYMQVVVTNQPDSEERAKEIFDEAFEKGSESAEGWQLTGEPLLVELFQHHIAEWGKWISTAPEKLEMKKSHLRLVKE